MKRSRKKITVRATALALASGVVTVLVTAVPASASTVTSFSPVCGVAGTSVTITGTGFTGMTGVTFDAGGVNPEPAVTWGFVNDTTATAVVPAPASTGPIRVDTPVNDNPSVANFQVVPAAAATITSFAPTSGAVGTSVVITGTNFCGATGVAFNVTAATSFTVDSNTQITTTVPAGATTGPVHVTTPSGTADSATNFTVTAGAPTITSFTPTSGPVGTSVVITGTNFTGATSVRFNVTAATFTVNSATQITATVPAGATTGKISVTTPGGTATSAGNFTVTVQAASHPRTVTFSYRGHRASGNVSVGDGFGACRAFVPVYIQQLRGGTWRLLDTTATNANGAYRTWVPDRNGRFRALVKELSLPGGVTCGRDRSPVRR